MCLSRILEQQPYSEDLNKYALRFSYCLKFSIPSWYEDKEKQKNLDSLVKGKTTYNVLFRSNNRLT